MRTEADGETVLRVTHNPRPRRSLAAPGTAQLTHHLMGALVIDVHLLADERGTSAVGTAVSISRQRPYSAAQKDSLELLYLSDRRSHACLGVSSPDSVFLLDSRQQRSRFGAVALRVGNLCDLAVRDRDDRYQSPGALTGGIPREQHSRRERIRDGDGVPHIGHDRRRRLISL